VLRRPVESAQDPAIRYTERLDAAGDVGSVGSTGESDDNAAAESVIGLYKTEFIRRRDAWRGGDDFKLATLGPSTGSTTAPCTAPAATFHGTSTRTTATPF